MRRGSMLVMVVSLACVFAQGQIQEQENRETRRVISSVQPSYPELAKKLRIDGSVRILAIVSPTGKVTRTEVLGGSPLLAKAAEDAVAKWKWVPGPQESKELIQLKFLPQQ